MLEFSKPKYPQKQTINLAVEETNGIGKQGQVAIFFVFLIVLGLFTKFAVIDRIDEAEKAKNEYIRTEEQIKQLTDRVKNYNEVQQVYRQYDDSFLHFTLFSKS